MAEIDYQARAIAVLKIHPGIEIKRFAEKIGLKLNSSARKSGNGSRKSLSDEADRMIQQMTKDGILYVEEPNEIYESCRIYPVGYQPQKPKPGRVAACTITFDPYIRGSWEPPVKQSLESMDDQNPAMIKILHIIEDAKQAAVERRRQGVKTAGMPTKAEICRQAGVPENYLAPSMNQRTAQVARDAYHEACRFLAEFGKAAKPEAEAAEVAESEPEPFPNIASESDVTEQVLEEGDRQVVDRVRSDSLAELLDNLEQGWVNICQKVAILQTAIDAKQEELNGLADQHRAAVQEQELFGQMRKLALPKQ